MADQATMTIDAVIEAFGTAGQVLPREAMQWALDNWTVAAPRFLEMLEHYTNGTDRPQPTTDALLFIVHLLGEKSETAAFQNLCRLLREQGMEEVTLHDAIIETWGQILISTYDGDVAALHAVIESVETDPFARHAAMLAMAYLTRIGRIPEADTHAYLRHLLAEMQPQEPSPAWVGLADCVAVLGLTDLVPDVKQVFRRGLIERFVMEYSHFEEDLKQTLDDPDRMAGFISHHMQPFTGAINELASWVSASEGATVEASLPDEPTPGLAYPQSKWPYQGGERNPLRNIGRNDPCPCGSGKKFKKCCMGNPEAEALLANALIGA